MASSTAPKPSGLLLDYVYAASAVMVWGRNVETLSGEDGVVAPPEGASGGEVVSRTAPAFDPLEIPLIASRCHPAAIKARAEYREQFFPGIRDWAQSVVYDESTPP